MGNFKQLSILKEAGVFITGTDTGVGKTFVTALIAENLIGKGIDIGVMKPISTGPKAEDDALYLKKRLKLKDPLSLINPIHLKHPLSPFTAAKIENRKLKIEKVFSACRKLEKRHDLLLVEGIGGVLVPITKDYFVVDLIKDLGLAAIIVARAGLGTINHTLLTIEALKKRKVKVLGIVLNGWENRGLAERTNPSVIETISGLPILAKIKCYNKQHG
jgi:dethiobiotin synthetase